MDRKRKKYIKSCEISEVCNVSLGGIKQKILIEGFRTGSPIVLFLHGGPGFPIPFCVGARGLFPDVTKRFTAVYWDQLGCGANNYPLTDRFDTEEFVRMTEQLVRYLKGRFPMEKLYLVGISWGSVLSLRTALALPHLVNGVFSVGQVLMPPLRSEEFFAAVENSAAPEKIKAQIREIKSCPLPSVKQILLISAAAHKYTDAYGMKGDRRGKNSMKGIMASKDYRFKDFLACFNNGYRKNTILLQELSGIDLRQELACVRIPYTILGGMSDLVTPVKDVKEFIESSELENLKLIEVENEGHIPTPEMVEKLFSALAEAAGV